MRDNDTGAAEPAVSAEQVIRIAEHYHKAQRKHPYFADVLFREARAEGAEADLAILRRSIGCRVELGYVIAESLLNCKFCEANAAFAKGDAPAAVGELYDAIAVLLRMIDVIEGRQKLGKANAANGGAA